ncbi:MAG TPA: B12-binding domain-containing radical SAM protein, partial [Oligoflexia bacterium]|nr:B12-binding domain-containing radical SAM protein [Oligoflexia bacterium]
VLLLTPPMTQLNTPYPASAALYGFLKNRAGELNVQPYQRDLSIELACRIFSASGLKRVRERLKRDFESSAIESESVQFFLEAADDYVRVVDSVVAFLQGKNPSLATRLAGRTLVPEGPRFLPLQDSAVGHHLLKMFGEMGVQDQAKYLGSLFLDDLADVIAQGIDSRFSLARYGEKLAASQTSFAALNEALESEAPTLVDEMLDELSAEVVAELEPELICLSAPFPGNVYGAFRVARQVKLKQPNIKLALGGGYVNTELRRCSETRVFNYFDFLVFDDGARPLLNILEFLHGKRPQSKLLRTLVGNGTSVQWCNDAQEDDIPMAELGAPSYEGLNLAQYISVIEMLNPMHRIWSDARWNKLTIAHGCYWKKCTFCDTSLDYIGRYQNTPSGMVVDHMQALVRETGVSGFHFVDEAAPPAALRAISEEILKRDLVASWWGNLRFEKSFTSELAQLMSDAGCIAVTGGLEVATNRLLKLMDKGVTVEQVARVTKNFANAGILVHAYLMYGFPSQTLQDTVDSLELVRQLFENDCLKSAYWHRFSATVHSPIGRNPERFGIKVLPKKFEGFAENDLEFVDPTGVDHDVLGRALRRALYNYMHGLGLREDVRGWFGDEGIEMVPRPSVARNLVRNALRNEDTSLSGETENFGVRGVK